MTDAIRLGDDGPAQAQENPLTFTKGINFELMAL